MMQNFVLNISCIFSTFSLYAAIFYRMAYKNKEDPVLVPRELKSFALKFQSNFLCVISSLPKGYRCSLLFSFGVFICLCLF